MPPHIRPGLLKLHVTLSLLTHVFGTPPQLNASHQVLGHVSTFNISSSWAFLWTFLWIFRWILIPYFEQDLCLWIDIFPFSYQAFQHSYEATVVSGMKQLEGVRGRSNRVFLTGQTRSNSTKIMTWRNRYLTGESDPQPGSIHRCLCQIILNTFPH